MIIHTFWHGPVFSFLERLTLKSFLNAGYTVNLWCYTREHSVDCPEQVNICDANEILPESSIFTYKGLGDCRKGSLGGFSDLFRYHLIYKQGGVYVDMDSTCLAYYDFKEEYIIKPHKSCGTVANILKAPKGCQFLKDCIDSTERLVNENNSTWVLPVKIFNENVIKHNLEKYIAPVEFFGNDDPDTLYKIKSERYLNVNKQLPKYILHWCREASHGGWNYREIFDWNNPKPLSVFYNLLSQNRMI